MSCSHFQEQHLSSAIPSVAGECLVAANLLCAWLQVHYKRSQDRFTECYPQEGCLPEGIHLSCTNQGHTEASDCITLNLL